jgi:hypothetical protein
MLRKAPELYAGPTLPSSCEECAMALAEVRITYANMPVGLGNVNNSEEMLGPGYRIVAGFSQFRSGLKCL